MAGFDASNAPKNNIKAELNVSSAMPVLLSLLTNWTEATKILDFYI